MRVRAMLAPLALWLLVAARTVAAQELDPAVPTDSAARVAVEAEVRAFYRDLDARNWPSLMTHFWPAKVAAGWQHPAWPWPTDAAGADHAASRDGGAGEVRVAGRWARVVVARRATSAADHFWLLDMNRHWKIVRLSLGRSR